MTLSDLIPEGADVMRALPGLLGSVVSMLWINDTWPRKILMVLAGAALATFGTVDAVRMTGISDGLAGFLLGLFGMSIASSLIKGWVALDLSAILRDALRQLLRLPPLPPKKDAS